MKRAAIYARVSTRNGHQDPETQLLALPQVAERAGRQVVVPPGFTSKIL
jgi:predicted site-specific integrase-resolvase